jgi:hypothetical protein
MWEKLSIMRLEILEFGMPQKLSIMRLARASAGHLNFAGHL